MRPLSYSQCKLHYATGSICRAGMRRTITRLFKRPSDEIKREQCIYREDITGHNLTGIASQFAMHLGFTCDVISVLES